MIGLLDEQIAKKQLVEIATKNGKTVKGYRELAGEPGYDRWVEYKMRHVDELAAADGLIQAAISACENLGVCRTIIFIMMKGLVRTMETQCETAGRTKEGVAEAFSELVMFADFSFRESELTKRLMKEADRATEGYA